MPNPLEASSVWYTGTVLHGDQVGRTLHFPTANFDPALLSHIQQEGVYAATVRLGSQNYRGALYLGPRITLGETRRVLEIHIIDFNGDIYDKLVEFQLGSFIRPPSDFPDVQSLIHRLQADVQAIATQQ